MKLCIGTSQLHTYTRNASSKLNSIPIFPSYPNTNATHSETTTTKRRWFPYFLGISSCAHQQQVRWPSRSEDVHAPWYQWAPVFTPGPQEPVNNIASVIICFFPVFTIYLFTWSPLEFRIQGITTAFARSYLFPAIHRKRRRSDIIQDRRIPAGIIKSPLTLRSFAVGRSTASMARPSVDQTMGAESF